jgi:hypothetical protein
MVCVWSDESQRPGQLTNARSFAHAACYAADCAGAHTGAHADCAGAGAAAHAVPVRSAAAAGALTYTCFLVLLIDLCLSSQHAQTI